MICANPNCRRETNEKRGRGLCPVCHQNTTIRNQFPCKRREWTAGEVNRLKQMREQGLSVTECAKRLGRTFGQVQGVCHTRRFVQHLKRPDFYRAEVKRLWRPDWTDDMIASQIGCHRNTVKRYRVELGLKKGTRPTMQRRQTLRCWCCNKRSPFYNHSAKFGWKIRKFAGHGNEKECYCPTCFKQYGWPKTYPRIAPRDFGMGRVQPYMPKVFSIGVVN